MQTDPKYAKHPYGTKYEKGKTIKSSGCGPTAMSMIIATWVDPTVTPITCADWSLAHGYKATDNGTYHSYFVPQAKEYGLECEKTYNFDKCRAAINDGAIAVVLFGPGNWTSGGHYCTWYDNDGDDVLIRDPASTKASRARNTYKMLLKSARVAWIVYPPKEVINMKNSEVQAYIKSAVDDKFKGIEAEVMKIADERIQKYLTDLSHDPNPSGWAKEDWEKATAEHLMDGTMPKMYLTREQFATVAHRVGMKVVNDTLAEIYAKDPTKDPTTPDVTA